MKTPFLRIKELDYLCGLSNLVETSDDSLDVLIAFGDRLATYTHYLYPARTRWKYFVTANLKQTFWQQRPIHIFGKPVGSADLYVLP
jgi:hypothetical protein